MLKEERIYREILIGVQRKKGLFYQNRVSKECGVSIGLVNKTIKKLERQSSIQKKVKGFSVIDPSKVLLYWATRRNIQKDVSTKFCIKKDISSIEKTLPSCVIFTGYSGWRLSTGRTPVDYREVYVYMKKKDEDKIDLWLNENKPSKGLENLFIMCIDDLHLINNSEKNIAPIPQIFVDLYSMGGLSSKYFLNDILDVHPEFKFEV